MEVRLLRLKSFRWPPHPCPLPRQTGEREFRARTHGGTFKMRCASESLAALRVKVPPRLNMNDNTKT